MHTLSTWASLHFWHRPLLAFSTCLTRSWAAHWAPCHCCTLTHSCSPISPHLQFPAVHPTYQIPLLYAASETCIPTQAAFQKGSYYHMGPRKYMEKEKLYTVLASFPAHSKLPVHLHPSHTNLQDYPHHLTWISILGSPDSSWSQQNTSGGQSEADRLEFEVFPCVSMVNHTLKRPPIFASGIGQREAWSTLQKTANVSLPHCYRFEKPQKSRGKRTRSCQVWNSLKNNWKSSIWKHFRFPGINRYTKKIISQNKAKYYVLPEFEKYAFLFQTLISTPHNLYSMWGFIYCCSSINQPWAEGKKVSSISTHTRKLFVMKHANKHFYKILVFCFNFLHFREFWHIRGRKERKEAYSTLLSIHKNFTRISDLREIKR